MPGMTIAEGLEQRGEKVRMKALAFGTVSGPYGILHTDPKGDDKQAREPFVYPAEAAVLEKAELAKQVRQITVDVPDDVPYGTDLDAYGSRVAHRAAERMAGVAEIEADLDAPSGLDSRMTSHHGDGRLELGTRPETAEEVDEAPKRGRGRPPKVAPPADATNE